MTLDLSKVAPEFGVLIVSDVAGHVTQPTATLRTFTSAGDTQTGQGKVRTDLPLEQSVSPFKASVGYFEPAVAAFQVHKRRGCTHPPSP